MKVEFYQHNLQEEDKKECMKVLDSVFLTTGQTVKDFEKQFASILGSRFAVGVTSCTAALFLALKYYGVSEGDEVITTPMSFVASANAIEFCGAKPVFVDVEPFTGNIDADLIEKAITGKTKVIMPIHLYGQMCDMKKIKSLADRYNIKIIEDSSHCVEGSRDGINPGQLGNMACFSFYATKNLTCGEGGALICNEEEIYEWLIKARLHGMSKSAQDRYTSRYQHYDMEFLGYKYNMSNFQAALLIHQMKRLELYLQDKEKIAKAYDTHFLNNKGIAKPEILPNSKHARLLYTIWVDPKQRDNFLHKIQDKGIGVAINFRAIHLMKYYRDKYNYKPGDFPICEKIGDSTITIPFYPKLTTAEINYVGETINSIVE